ncbi:(E3-independent) E2 ubiquitin-conjugating enzyme [Ranunculus cassubicifolius]
MTCSKLVNKAEKEITMFKKFEIVKDFSDHHYAKPKKSPSGVEKFRISFAGKGLRAEFSRLDKQLSEMIYVRAYEGRPGLLRAMIVGAADTSYHDNIFLFDISFSEEYPVVAPKIHYHSFGHSINPIFCKTGKVYLEYLGAWSLASRLLFIQAVVLTEKPYFNKPVHGQWAGIEYWEKKAYAYNEKVFLKSCKTMLCLLAKPPMHFQELIALHFHNRGATILHACRAYMDGGLIEYGSSALFAFVPSKNFKSSMKILYPKLLAAFVTNASSLRGRIEYETSLHKLEEMNEEEKEKSTKNVFYKLLCK